MAKHSRDRMIASAAALLGTRGLAETSFAEVIAASGAPRGSIYHHFPRGKPELVGAAVRWTSELVVAHLRGSSATTASEVLEHFVALFRRTVDTSACRAGCPVAAVVVGSYPGDDPWARAVRTSFRAWSGLLATQLGAVGVPRPRARSLAVTALAGIEGALVLCRAERSVAPLNQVAAELRRLAVPLDVRTSGSVRRRAGRPGRK